MTWRQWARGELEAIRAADRLRRLRPFDGSATCAVMEGRSVISFATNDYLGLACHPEVQAAAHAAIEKFGTSSASSRLITGTRSLHAELESALASWKQCERALVFPTGFQANLGVLSTLGTQDATIFSDALNHASIIDGCRLARAATMTYRHGDCEHLQSLLRATPGRKIVVTDSVFSMDGDIAPLAQLAALCARYQALLVIDEAHAALAVEVPLLGDLELLRVGTLSKTLGSLGGWIAGPAPLIELMINRARSFIYTTGLSPADTAAALAALRILRSPDGDSLRARLRRLVDRLRPGHPSPIVPVVLGTDRSALAAAESLLGAGIYVPAIRPPTVPDGTARLRIAVSAAHSEAMIDRLLSALAAIAPAESRA